MDYFSFCYNIMEKEQQKFSCMVTKNDIISMTNINCNYDSVYNRCAYMYRYAACNMFVFENCIKNFLNSYSDIKELILKWNRLPELKLCSLSHGPAVDFVAFKLALSECTYFGVKLINYNKVKKVKLLTKHGAWRNTVNLMLESIVRGNFSFINPSLIEEDSVEVIQGNVFNAFSDKLKLILQEVDVILMMKTFSFIGSGNEESAVLSGLQELFAAMKPDSIIFCVDNKPSIELLMKTLSKYPGKFLYPITVVNMKFPVKFLSGCSDTYGCVPVKNGKGFFFVWQKSEGPILNETSILLSQSSEVSVLNQSCMMSDCKVNVENSVIDKLFKKYSNTISPPKTLNAGTVSSECTNKSSEPTENIEDISAASVYLEQQASCNSALNLIRNNDDKNDSQCSSDIDKTNTRSNAHDLLLKFDSVSTASTFPKLGNSFTSKTEVKAIPEQELQLPAFVNDVKDVKLNKIKFPVKQSQNKFVQTDFKQSECKENNTIANLIKQINELTSSFEGLLKQKQQSSNSSENKCACCDCSVACESANRTKINIVNSHLQESCKNQLNNHENCCQLKNNCIISCHHNKCFQPFHCCKTLCCVCRQHLYCQNESGYNNFQGASLTPNIVIPLDALSNDAIAQIVSILKNSCKG